MTAQVNVFLSSTREDHIEFLAPGFSSGPALAAGGVCEVTQQMGNLPVSNSVCLIRWINLLQIKKLFEFCKGDIKRLQDELQGRQNQEIVRNIHGQF